MKFGDLLNTLAGKLGLQNDPAVIDILSRTDSQQIDIPDAIANRMNAELMSLEGAKNNAQVKSHFTALAYNGIDSELANSLNTLGIEDIFGDEKNTGAKLRALTAKMKDLLEQKEGATGKDKAELTTQINELNAKLATVKTDYDTKLAEVTKQHQEQMLDYRVMSSLQGKNYANKDVDSSVNVKFAKTLLSEAMQTKGAKLVIDENEQLILRQSANADLDFYDQDNKKVSYDDFVSSVLAENKLLAVTDQTKVNTPAAPQFTPAPGTGAQPVNTAKFEAAIQQSLNDVAKK